jgi:formylglycine-generating enzyme required for sulfatase activity
MSSLHARTGFPGQVALIAAVFLGAAGLHAEPSADAASPSAKREAPPAEIALSCGNEVTLSLKRIPAGEFAMGSPTVEPGRGVDEVRHTVTITRAFYLGTYEVTQAQYAAVMGTNPSWFKGEDRPVDWVSWHEAVEFCRRLSRTTGKQVRLPTEAEWEYACRAGRTTAFAFGESITPNQANFKGASTQEDSAKGLYRRQTLPVGKFRPNAWGLYDMHGNVMEWCADRYEPFPDKEPSNTDPSGAESGPQRVLRGGAWCGRAEACRSAARFCDVPRSAYADTGFRVAVTAP